MLIEFFKKFLNVIMLNSFLFGKHGLSTKKFKCFFYKINKLGKLFLNQCSPILLNKYTTSTSMLSIKILQHEWKLLTSIHFQRILWRSLIQFTKYHKQLLEII